MSFKTPYFLLIMLFATIAHAQESKNVIPAEANASFEEGDQESPANWKKWTSPGNDEAGFLWEQNAHASRGAKVAGLSGGHKGLTMAWVMTSPIPVESGGKYVLSLASLQRQTAGAKFQIRINWCKTENRVSLEKFETLTLPTQEDADWQEQTFTVEVPDDCAGMALELQQVGRSQGEIFFDNLRLERMK